MACSAEETVESWLIRNGQTARLREMLWDPLALAALNQPSREAAAPTFVRVLAEMFGRDPQAASIAFPAVPLDALYVAPGQDYVEARGGDIVANALARVIVEGGRAVGVRTRGGREIRAHAVVSAVPWYAIRALFDEVPAPMRQVESNASRTGSCPIVTVNLWFDRRVLGTPFVGLPGRAMQWAFDRGAITDSNVSHVSLVSSGAASVVVDAKRRHRGPRDERTPRCAAVGASRRSEEGVCCPRAPGDVLAGSRPACAAGCRDAACGLLPGRRLDRYGIAGYD